MSSLCFTHLLPDTKMCDIASHTVHVNKTDNPKGYTNAHTHLAHDFSAVEHHFVPLAEAIFRSLLSFSIC